MTSSEELGNHLVQLGRLAMSGQERDVDMYLQRLARRLRTTHPETAAALTALVRDARTKPSPLRVRERAEQ